MAQTMLTVGLPLALAWMMFCVGLTLSVADFKRVLQYPGKVGAGLLAQLVGLPIIAFASFRYLLCHPSLLLAYGSWHWRRAVLLQMLSVISPEEILPSRLP